MSTIPNADPFAGSHAASHAATGSAQFVASATVAGPGAGTVSGATDPALVQEMRNEIRALVQEISQLSQSDIPVEQFYAEYLSRLVGAMAAVGGAIWTIRDGKLALAQQLNLPPEASDEPTAGRARHGLLLKKIVGGGQSLVVPPQSGAADSNEPGNPTDLLLVVAPLIVENEVQAVVEVFQRPGGGPTTQRGYIRFLNQMAELACDYLRSRRLRALTQQQELWKQLEQFLQAIHGTLDVQQTAFAIVNEGRRLAQCDRASLALCRGENCSIAAVSGLDTLDRRASEVADLARLAQAVVRAGQPFWHAAGEDDAPPQIDAPLQAYVDRSHAKLVAVLPLFPSVAVAEGDRRDLATVARRPIGALILEQIKDDRPSESLRMRADVIAQHSAAALANSLEHSRVFLLPVWKAIGKLTWLFSAGTLPKTVLVALAIVGAATALAVVPADFDVAARGKLQPAVRREVFARIDGTVMNVPVAHGQLVERGTLLAELSSTDLEVELAALVGRQTTNQQQIAASQRAQLDNTNFNGARLSPAEQNRLASEIMQMRQEAENIERELALFREKQKQLVVQAGERGQVITWKVQDLLLHRPVQRGQVLMTLADPDGPWELELRVPERRLRHLDAAQRDAAKSPDHEPLEVIFMLASHPGQEFRGRVVEIERTAEVRGDEGSSVLVRVAIDKSQLPQLHDQTSVTARLRCGRTSIGYTWFCDLIETVQAKVLFWL